MKNKEFDNPEFVLFLKTGKDTVAQVVMSDDDKKFLSQMVCTMYQDKNIKIGNDMPILYGGKSEWKN